MRAQWYQDEPRSSPTIPPVKAWRATSQIVALLVLFFLLQVFFRSETWLALHSDHLVRPWRWYEFFTYALVHDRYDLFHLAFNALAIWFFGRDVETHLGGRAAFYRFAAGAALCASLTFVVLHAVFGGGPVMLYGASGLAYACLVAYGTLFPHAQVILFVFPMRAWVLCAIVMAVAAWAAFVGGGGGVAHTAHLGGGAFGFVAARYGGAVDRWWESLRERRRRLDRRREVERRREVDRILAKISREGLGSLTRRERRTLKAASRELARRKKPPRP